MSEKHFQHRAYFHHYVVLKQFQLQFTRHFNTAFYDRINFKNILYQTLGWVFQIYMFANALIWSGRYIY